MGQSQKYLSCKASINVYCIEHSYCVYCYVLLYINDLCNVSKVVDFILFADDTNIFFSHKDFNSLSETLNSEMCKLTQ